MRSGIGAAAALLCAAAVAPHLLSGQDVEALANACAVAAREELTSPCLEGALSVQAAQGLLGLAAAGGTEIPGSSSTLGKRFGGTPRFGLAAGLVLVDADLPGGLAPSSGNAPSEGSRALGVQATAAAGLFQGFSTAPTVGGILAVDLLATFTHVGLPSDRGFEGGSNGFGLGTRIGVLRESFTLPAITLSGTRRWMTSTSFISEDGQSRAELDLTVTSLRFTVGKELLAFGVLGGVGWDRYGGAVDLQVRPDGSSGPRGQAADGSFTTDRVLFFAGAGYTFLVAQVAAEAGWARGYEDVPDRAQSGYDPGSGSFFGRISFRLTL